MRNLFAVLLALAMATPAIASPLNLNLSAQVPVQCQILDIQMLNLKQGHLRVQVACNASAFSLVMGGSLRHRQIHSASASNATVTASHNQVRVTPSRPGLYQFDLMYDGSLTDISVAQAEIQPL